MIDSVRDPERSTGHPELEGTLHVIAFGLGGEHFAINVLDVEEVVSGQRIHALPDVPRTLMGVLLLRGGTVPVLDGSESLRVAAVRSPVEDVIIIGHRGRSIGLATDGVLGTRSIPAASVRPLPADVAATRPLLGVVPSGEELLILIDPHPLISLQDPLL